VVVVTGYDDTAALDIVTGGVLWSTGAPTASDRRDGASLLPPIPWNLLSIIADGQVNPPAA
jgi:hypothetical protein